MNTTETFRVEAARKTATLRVQCEWLRIEDDWHTQPLRLALLPPPLAFAAASKPPLVAFSKKPFDMELLTPAGPCFGVENVDAWEATFALEGGDPRGAGILPAGSNSPESAGGTPAALFFTNAPPEVRATLAKWSEAFLLPEKSASDSADLTPALRWEHGEGVNRTPLWPDVAGWDWKTSTGAPWSLGKVAPAPGGPPRATPLRINAHTQAVLYE